ncbi:transcription initiation factor TFIID subunit 7 [Selaginella moellendorffii]|uniref:transcription initiation factor TFIID subunit 7 n=1 Tax=Selaginella moellendorffii TaxID=88036 RepID=UPI000D1C9A20|nr:transcription initiation factor TFIID subunit 7 [Selaginella moellendorffii]|eukprot:XP_002977669.2 transcription initiation factor TFIID subunit 7 [Selaginella moellendorffii]
MEEHFILRVPPSVAERLNGVLSERAQAPEDEGIDICFRDARTGMFTIGKDQFEVSLVDLPCVVESYKTYDDTVLIKAADIGQMILVRDNKEPAPEGVEHKDGLTPAMRDARKRRFRRDAEIINPDFVHNVENDLVNILAGGTARDVDVEVVEQEEDVEEAEPVPAPVAVPPPVQPAAAVVASDKIAAAPKATDEYDDSSDENGYYEDSDDY